MYKKCYDKLQPLFEKNHLQLLYMNTDRFVISINTKAIIKDLKNLDDLFDLSILNGNHDLINIGNKKVFGKFRIETPKIVSIDESNCLRC